MRSYAQYCPISRAADLLGERWTLLILREMLTGSSRFNDFARGLPGLSRGLLAKRLREMQAAGLIKRAIDGYELTPAGEEVRPLVFLLGEWGAKWAFGEPQPAELDPDVLMWWIHGRIAPTEPLTRIVVVQIQFTDVRRWYWLVLEPGDVSVCLTDPGFDVDACLRTDLKTMYEVWLGRGDLAAALRAGVVTIEGSSPVARSLPKWLQLSPIAYASVRLREDAQLPRQNRRARALA